MLVQSPNFFGVIEDIPAIAEIAHAKGALLIVSIAEAVSLGVVRPPVEADIVSMEAQSFGVALSYGGPFCGVIAAKEKYRAPDAGQACRADRGRAGNRGFVLTLATREQHIRREKATSNICTNQALVALMATIFLAVYGKEGMRELAEHNLAKAEYAAQTLSAQPGAKLRFTGAPRFHEFVLQTEEAPVGAGRTDCSKTKSSAGWNLSRWYPELGNCTLWCATEVTARESIDSAAEVMAAKSTSVPACITTRSPRVRVRSRLGFFPSMRASAILQCGAGALPRASGAFAQSAPVLDRSGQITVDGKAVPYLIRHLPVSSFPRSSESNQRCARVSQLSDSANLRGAPPENVFHASLERAGSNDWAALCSEGETVSLMVFFASAPAKPFVLASAPETEHLQLDTATGVYGFNWAIDPASPQRVHEAARAFDRRSHCSITMPWQMRSSTTEPSIISIREMHGLCSISRKDSRAAL